MSTSLNILKRACIAATRTSVAGVRRPLASAHTHARSIVSLSDVVSDAVAEPGFQMEMMRDLKVERLEVPPRPVHDDNHRGSGAVFTNTIQDDESVDPHAHTEEDGEGRSIIDFGRGMGAPGMA